jgi:hypothetical protein
LIGARELKFAPFPILRLILGIAGLVLVVSIIV